MTGPARSGGTPSAPAAQARLLHRQVKRGRSRMTQDDVLFGYRLQLFDLRRAHERLGRRAGRSGCTARPITRWKRQVDRHGLEMLRPRERRRPQMPNQLPQMIEERIVSFSIAHPGPWARAGRVGARRGAKWGGIVVSAQRGLEGALPPRAQHARQAPGADRRLRRALRAAARARARAAHRRRPAGRAGRDRLLLRRAAAAAPTARSGS